MVVDVAASGAASTIITSHSDDEPDESTSPSSGELGGRGWSGSAIAPTAARVWAEVAIVVAAAVGVAVASRSRHATRSSGLRYFEASLAITLSSACQHRHKGSISSLIGSNIQDPRSTLISVNSNRSSGNKWPIIARRLRLQSSGNCHDIGWRPWTCHDAEGATASAGGDGAYLDGCGIRNNAGLAHRAFAAAGGIVPGQTGYIR